MRDSVDLSFRLLDRPHVSACSTTRESTRWRKRVRVCFRCSTRHLSDVSTALISRALICSGVPVHLQPLTTFQCQSFAGTDARNLWNLVN